MFVTEEGDEIDFSFITAGVKIPSVAAIKCDSKKSETWTKRGGRR